MGRSFSIDLPNMAGFAIMRSLKPYTNQMSIIITKAGNIKARRSLQGQKYTLIAKV